MTVSYPLSAVALFWSKVDQTNGPDACWMWQAGKDKDGYGKFQFIKDGDEQQTHVRAHRFALELTTGHSGEVAKHECDTPGCCNPRHLAWGDHLSNRMDCVKRHRHARGATSNWILRPETVRRGAAHPRARLTEMQVADIRQRYIPRKGVGALAREFGITRSHLNALVRRHTWK